MMLEFLGEDEAAARVRDAVAKSEDATGSTTELGDQIAELVQSA
jgi:isocitrate/isopropylmalate dehydrogenase